MVTDLRAALRDAVASAPADDTNLAAALVAPGRQRVRRRRVAAGAAAVLVAATVGAAVLLPTRTERTEPVITPSPSPTPPDPTLKPSPTPTTEPTHQSETSMTPREVVLADNATLKLTGVSADDPGFRISVWVATCTWCPKKSPEHRARPSFSALAITTDGFQTTTYRPAPVSPDYSLHVISPGPGMLMIVESANGGEWLVRDDGTVTQMARVVEERQAGEPRLWFECLSTWCALDPDANTVFVWRDGYIETSTDTRSAVSPGAGVEPWGYDWKAAGLVAWWDDGGVRQRRLLEEEPTGLGNEEYFHIAPVFDAPGGGPMYWSAVNGTDRLTLHRTNDGGGTWQSVTRDIPTMPRFGATLLGTPGGALIMQATDYDPKDNSAHSRMWRSESFDEGEWVLVYDSGEGLGHDMASFTVVGDDLWSGNLTSSDDGLSWSEITTWR